MWRIKRRRTKPKTEGNKVIYPKLNSTAKPNRYQSRNTYLDVKCNKELGAGCTDVGCQCQDLPPYPPPNITSFSDITNISSNGVADYKTRVNTIGPATFTDITKWYGPVTNLGTTYEGVYGDTNGRFSLPLPAVYNHISITYNNPHTGSGSDAVYIFIGGVGSGALPTENPLAYQAVNKITNGTTGASKTYSQRYQAGDYLKIQEKASVITTALVIELTYVPNIYCCKTAPYRNPILGYRKHLIDCSGNTDLSGCGYTKDVSGNVYKDNYAKTCATHPEACYNQVIRTKQNKNGCVDESYNYSTNQYLNRRCLKFQQQEFNFQSQAPVDTSGCCSKFKSCNNCQYKTNGDCDCSANGFCTGINKLPCQVKNTKCYAIYKRSNPKFKKQGAVSGGSRINRLKYQTRMKAQGRTVNGRKNVINGRRPATLYRTSKPLTLRDNTCINPPPPPSNLFAEESHLIENAMFISWKNPDISKLCRIAPITGFTIQRTGSPFGHTVNIGLTNQYDYLNVPQGIYDIRIKTNSYYGSSDWAYLSNIGVFNPAKINDLKGQHGNSSVTLTWTKPHDGGFPITDYEYSVNNGSFILTNSTNTTVTIPSLTNGISYTFKVRAINGNPTVDSNIISVTPSTIPDAPTNLQSPQYGSGTVDLTWTAPTNNGGNAISEYAIYTNPVGSSGSPIFTTTAATSFTVTGLSNGTTYTFTVSANNINGLSNPSASVSATPSTIPDAPTNLAASHGNTSVDLTWTAPTDNGGNAISEYAIYTNPVGPSGNPIFTNAATTSFTVIGLTNGISYTFNVSAKNINGLSNQSASKSATPSTTPGAPINFTVSSGGNGVLELSWDSPSNTGGASLTNYEYSENANFIPSVITYLNPIKIPGKNNNQTYTYYIRAQNINGVGPSTNASGATSPNFIAANTFDQIDYSTSGFPNPQTALIPATPGNVVAYPLFTSIGRDKSNNLYAVTQGGNISNGKPVLQVWSNVVKSGGPNTSPLIWGSYESWLNDNGNSDTFNYEKNVSISVDIKNEYKTWVAYSGNATIPNGQDTWNVALKGRASNSITSWGSVKQLDSTGSWDCCTGDDSASVYVDGKVYFTYGKNGEWWFSGFDGQYAYPININNEFGENPSIFTADYLGNKKYVICTSEYDPGVPPVGITPVIKLVLIGDNVSGSWQTSNTYTVPGFTVDPQSSTSIFVRPDDIPTDWPVSLPDPKKNVYIAAIKTVSAFDRKLCFIRGNDTTPQGASTPTFTWTTYEITSVGTLSVGERNCKMSTDESGKNIFITYKINDHGIGIAFNNNYGANTSWNTTTVFNPSSTSTSDPLAGTHDMVCIMPPPSGPLSLQTPTAVISSTSLNGNNSKLFIYRVLAE